MAQSLNTKADYSTEGIAYLGFAEYGKILIGDVAFEFYNDRNVEKNMTTGIFKFYYRIIRQKNGNRDVLIPNIVYFRNLLDAVDKKLHFLSEFSALPRANS